MKCEKGRKASGSNENKRGQREIQVDVEKNIGVKRNKVNTIKKSITEEKEGREKQQQ